MIKRLSEAMRLGCHLKPQTFGSYHDGTGTCALGAAFDAVGALDSPNFFAKRCELADGLWPLINITALEDCFLCGQTRNDRGLLGLIPHLNDHHRWTREQIADWIEAREILEETKAQQQQEAECTLTNS